MGVHQTRSFFDEMPFALVNEDQMADNVITVLPIELTNATGTFLQHLNEDCLLEIFSRNPLTPMDLCSLAETCKRFKQITPRMFSMGFAVKCRRSISDEIEYKFSSRNHSKLKCTFQDTERILKNFGSHLSELHMEDMEEDSAFVNLITKYCDDITLKRLGMSGFKSIEGVTQQLNSIFQRLLGLRFYECNLPITPWDMNRDSLIELEISFCENGTALLSNTFPILEQFCFHSEYSSSVLRENNIEALSEFVRRHGCLKNIEIIGESFDVCKLLHAISCSCNELVELTLERLPYDSFDISHLQSLAKLKVLKIRFESHPRSHLNDQPQCEDIDFSEALTSLKTMEISFDEGASVLPNQFFDVPSQLQGLRELKLELFELNDIPWARLTQLRRVFLNLGLVRSSYGLCGPLNIIGPLLNLEELKLGCIFFNNICFAWSLTEVEFLKIVKLVERRAHVLTLRCHYYFNYEENCSEKRKVKLFKF